MEIFSERLKELRKEKGLTQKELAQRILQSPTAIVYWEQNKHEPSASALKKICKFFDVSADYLLGIIDD